MSYPRRLDADQMDDVRRRYETTDASLRSLAAEYDVAKSTIQKWATKQSWAKYRPLADDRRQFDRAVGTRARANEEAALVTGLACSVKVASSKVASNAAKVAIACSARSARTTTPSPDRPAEPISAGASGSGMAPDGKVDPVPKRGKSNRPRSKAAQLVPLPTDNAPSRPDPAPEALHSAYSIPERAKIKLELGALHGILTGQQIAQLDRHQQLLDDYGYLLKLYLAPDEFVTCDDLDEVDRRERISEIRNAALSQLLPTERDTLAGAIKTLTSALSTTVQLKRLVAGTARAGIRDEQGQDGRRDVTALDDATLRQVREAMVALTGHRAGVAEPPKPPAPESIDDLTTQSA